MAVSMSVVSHSTNSMNAPISIPPGMSSLLDARIRIIRRNMIVKDAVTIANVKILSMLAAVHLTWTTGVLTMVCLFASAVGPQ